MALWLNISVSKQSQADINQTQVYQAYKDIGSVSMQDINTSERQREQSQTREICFEVRAPLLYIPTFNTMKDFNQNRSHRITRCRNTYKECTLELLDSLVPSLVPARTTHASILACRGRPLHCASTRTRNNTNPQVRLLKYKVEHLVI